MEEHCKKYHLISIPKQSVNFDRIGPKRNQAEYEKFITDNVVFSNLIVKGLEHPVSVEFSKW